MSRTPSTPAREALDALAGFPGDRSVAAHLARAGWKPARRTIQQPGTGRTVRARYPHHVWMLDLTEIPGFLRLFCFKLVVVLDVFSRMPRAARVLLLAAHR